MGNGFAIIVDEAHSSQTGEASKKMKAILGDTEGLTEEEQLQKVADEEAKEEHKQSDSEDEIAKEMATHGGWQIYPSLHLPQHPRQRLSKCLVRLMQTEFLVRSTSTL